MMMMVAQWRTWKNHQFLLVFSTTVLTDSDLAVCSFCWWFVNENGWIWGCSRHFSGLINANLMVVSNDTKVTYHGMIFNTSMIIFMIVSSSSSSSIIIIWQLLITLVQSQKVPFWRRRNIQCVLTYYTYVMSLYSEKHTNLGLPFSKSTEAKTGKKRCSYNWSPISWNPHSRIA